MKAIELIENFFRKNNQAVSISNLYKILKIQDSNKDDFLDALFELEKKGKIIYQDNMFIKVPCNSNLYHGKLQISNKGNFYISINKSSRINIKNFRQYKLKKDDIIYAEYRDNQNELTNSFIYDGNDLYFFIQNTVLTVDGTNYEIPPLSYVIVSYQNSVEIYNKQQDTYEIIPSTSTNVTASTDQYSINLSLDSMKYGEKEQLLLKRVDTLKSINT